jgi:sugar phosphate isomerase/epimerase
MAHTVGLQMYTLREKMVGKSKDELLDILKKVREIGYTSFQGGAPQGMSDKDFKKFCDDIGLKPLSSGGSGGLLGLLQNPGPAIESAHTMGVTELGISTVFIDLRWTEDGYKQYAYLINKVGETLKKEGLHLQYHNHSLEFHKFPSGRTGMDVLIDDTDPEALFFCLDCHWLQGAGTNPARWIRRVKDRMDTIHFKDYGIDLGTTVIEVTPRLFKAVGEGNIDWEPIVEASKEIGVKNYVVEQDIPDRDAFECAASSYNYITKVLGL